MLVAVNDLPVRRGFDGGDGVGHGTSDIRRPVSRGAVFSVL
jgi:hypothetical protein